MRGDFTGTRVLITGHTGFKGSWLAEWLKRDGAIVTGLSLPPEPNGPSIFEAARVADGMTSIIGDIRDLACVQSAMEASQPEVVFHLAAQPLIANVARGPVAHDFV